MRENDSGESAGLLADLRAMWQNADPMPADLPDSIIAAIASRDIDIELLTLTAPSGAVRGAAQILECAVDGLTLAVRIEDTPDGSRRVDGWSEGIDEIELLTDGPPRRTTTSDAGRFSFDRVPPGPVRLRLHTPDRTAQTNDFGSRP